MAVAIATTFAFGLWIVLWAIGYSGFDGLLVSVLIVLIAATIRSLVSNFTSDRRRGPGRANAPQGGW